MLCYVMCAIRQVGIITQSPYSRTNIKIPPPPPRLCYFNPYFNPFPHDKILDQTKLKAFADDKLNVTKMIISVFDRVENIAGKGEIACISNFSFSHNVLKRLLSQRRQKVSLCGNGLT